MDMINLLPSILAAQASETMATGIDWCSQRLIMGRKALRCYAESSKKRAAAERA
jgi:hypothetical protein